MKLKNFVNLFWRSFFMQSCWNYKSLQSVGFCFAILPIGRIIFKNDEKKLKEFIIRHLRFFNGHPYLISYALGTVASLEEEYKGSKETEKIEKFKEALVGPLGALGDQLFWAKIKPAVFTLGVLSFFIMESVSGRIMSVVLLLLLYNTPHLYIRISGILVGYKEKFSVVKYLKRDSFSKLNVAYTIMGILSVSFLIATLTAKFIFTNFYAILIFFMSIIISSILKAQLSKTYLAMIIPVSLAVLIGLIIKL